MLVTKHQHNMLQLRIIILLFLIIQVKLYCQPLKYCPLNKQEDKLNLEYIDKELHIFDNASVLGIGESTHGTKEFAIMRFDIFKHLTETKGFNTIFLEADYSACQRLNRYINGKTENLDSAIIEIMYFPWRTQEMKSFMEWCRAYNFNHNNKIQIVGCDMQSINDDILELKRIIKCNNLKDTLLNLLLDLKYPYNDTSVIKPALNQWDLFYKKNLHPTDTMGNYELLYATICQFMNHKLLTQPSYNYRDSCMAVNIKIYISNNTGVKGVFIAHNWHISNTEYQYSNKWSRKTAGSYLRDMGIQYTSIAQITNRGFFNAVSNETHKLSLMELRKSKKKTLENKLSKIEVPILICKYNDINSVEHLYYTEIGATFEQTKKIEKLYRYQKLSKDKFNYIIFFESTTASSLLK